MKNYLISWLLLLTVVMPAMAQAPAELEDLEFLERETAVLILKDGEQIVIRGAYNVEGNRTYFHYDMGRYPLYAQMDSNLIDFEATERANQKLAQERTRRENYYRLIAETQRKALEGEFSGPFIVDSDQGELQPAPEFAEDIEDDVFYIQTARDFPAYNKDDLEFQPESWWREESLRLFSALEEHNRRMGQLSQDHNTIALQIRQAESREQEQTLRNQIQQFRDAMQTERNLGRLIGNRLVELSEFAQELEIPMEWIIPDNSPVYQEETQ
jgi:hypothetical protein